jgi:hypothetical protein
MASGESPTVLRKTPRTASGKPGDHEGQKVKAPDGKEVTVLPFTHQLLLLLELQYTLLNSVLNHKPHTPAIPPSKVKKVGRDKDMM